MKTQKNDQSDNKRKLFENKYKHNIEKELNQNIFNSLSGNPSSKNKRREHGCKNAAEKTYSV